MVRVVLVCGGRRYTDEAHLFRVLDALFEQADKPDDFVVVNGDASGADSLSTKWAASRQVAHLCVPAKWQKYRHKAGPIRNRQMPDLMKIDLVLAFPGHVGTEDMIEYAASQGITVQRC